MEGALPTIALVAVIMSAGAIAVAAHFRKERAAELRDWARTHGWTYTDHLPRPLGESTLPRSTLGPHSRSRHVLTGRRGRHPVIAFEQTHTVGRGADRDRRTHRIVAVRTPGHNADLQILHKHDPNASEDVFGDAFHAAGSDPEFTEAVLDGTVTTWMLGDPRSRSLPIRFSGDYVLTWAAMRLDPDRALTAADYLIDLVERIPVDAWKRRTSDL